jgi:hypothetical protein
MNSDSEIHTLHIFRFCEFYHGGFLVAMAICTQQPRERTWNGRIICRRFSWAKDESDTHNFSQNSVVWLNLTGKWNPGLVVCP